MIPQSMHEYMFYYKSYRLLMPWKSHGLKPNDFSFLVFPVHVIFDILDGKKLISVGLLRKHSWSIQDHSLVVHVGPKHT